MLAATKKKKGTVKGCSLFNHPIQQLSRGEVLWDDEYVEAMAEGRQPEGKTDWNRILKPIDPNAVKDEKITTCDEACEKAMCPLYRERPLQLFDDATWTSDGEEVKHFNIRCLGTDSSPCSFCSHDREVKTPPAKKPKKETSEFAEAAGFNKHDYEGEEESPKKISATACKWWRSLHDKFQAISELRSMQSATAKKAFLYHFLKCAFRANPPPCNLI